MSDSSVAPRTPPHDQDAEVGVLGSMLLSPDAVYVARERLNEASFYGLAHQDIFGAIIALADAHNAVDTILLRDQLAKEDKLEKVGGVDYLLHLMESVPTSANVEYYVEIVRMHAIRRQLIETTARIQSQAYESSQEVDDLLDEAESHILGVRHQKDSGQTRDVNDVLQGVLERLEMLHQHPGQLTGIPSDFHDLDRITGGFQPGELTVVAARPSMGKTSFVLNILQRVCAIQRRPAALFSLEMSAEQVVSNFLCIHTQLNTHKFRVGSLKDRDWRKLEAAMDDLAQAPLYIDDSATLRVLDLRARARRLAHRHSIEMVVVDYLQLLQSNRYRENRANEVAEISRGLKALARELKVPVIAVAQLSRRVEQEQRQPRLSDLRESGAIEQDADVVLLLHRPMVDRAENAAAAAQVAQPPGDEPEERWDQPEMLYGNEADLIVAKQRNGPTGVVHMVFRNQYLRFESRATNAPAGTAGAPVY